ncbi:SDR family oxidoreductase [Roseivirga sp.]|uniref:SDR family oxidoreductase n=1 Tax=Roseivirga sp. TaxID=1964215 RepID=UPI003B5234F6
MKNAVITGCSSGFGKLTATTLARKGYKVWATMRDPETRNSNKKEELLAIAEEEGISIEVLELDVLSNDSVQRAIDKVISVDGKIDTLVNNAGVMFVGITEAYSMEQVQQQFDVNFFGVVRTTQAVLPHMREAKDGLIINVSSLAGRLSFPYFGVYCASKFALEAYTESIGYELAPFGIEVSINEPGPFGTGLLYSGPKEANSEVLSSYGDFKDVPPMMLKNFEGFFNSDEAIAPQTVADDITRVIESPKGERPARVVSGIDYGVNQFNEVTKPVQDSLIKDVLQMEHLMTVSQ